MRNERCTSAFAYGLIAAFVVLAIAGLVTQ